MAGMMKKTSMKKTRVDEDTDWTSIYIASILSFVGSTQFSLYFSSLWPYLQTLDTNATQNFFGFIIAIYSLGQIISAPLFGYWSNRIEQVKLPLIVGVALMILGNIFYLSLGIVAFPSYLMLIGRFITGMGSGNSALLRAYASTASTVRDRPRAIALVTCGQAIGNTAGPAFQLLFTPLGYPGFQLIPGMSIDMYTAPAYFACVMNFCGLLALFFLFNESYVGIIKKSSISKPIKLPKYDLIAIFVCYVTRFTQMFVNTNLETLGSPFSMMMFNWQESTAVIYTSAAQGALGALTFLVYIIYIFFNIEHYMTNFRLGCITSLVLFISFFFITFSWPFLPGYTYTKDISLNTTLTNTSSANIGCNTQQYSWCTSLNQVNVWTYYVTYVICISLAYAFNNIMLSTLFSRILGPRRQGTQQGILQNSGNIARMLGPILISSLYTSYGPRMVWIIDAAVVLITILLWLIFYKRMVPLKINSVSFKQIHLSFKRVDENKTFGSISNLSNSPDMEEKSNHQGANKIGISASLPCELEASSPIVKKKLRPVKSLYVPDVY